MLLYEPFSDSYLRVCEDEGSRWPCFLSANQDLKALADLVVSCTVSSRKCSQWYLWNGTCNFNTSNKIIFLKLPAYCGWKNNITYPYESYQLWADSHLMSNLYIKFKRYSHRSVWNLAYLKPAENTAYLQGPPFSDLYRALFNYHFYKLKCITVISNFISYLNAYYSHNWYYQKITTWQLKLFK